MCLPYIFGSIENIQNTGDKNKNICSFCLKEICSPAACQGSFPVDNLFSQVLININISYEWFNADKEILLFLFESKEIIMQENVAFLRTAVICVFQP